MTPVKPPSYSCFSDPASNLEGLDCSEHLRAPRGQGAQAGTHLDTQNLHVEPAQDVVRKAQRAGPFRWPRRRTQRPPRSPPAPPSRCAPSPSSVPSDVRRRVVLARGGTFSVLLCAAGRAHVAPPTWTPPGGRLTRSSPPSSPSPGHLLEALEMQGARWGGPCMRRRRGHGALPEGVAHRGVAGASASFVLLDSGGLAGFPALLLLLLCAEWRVEERARLATTLSLPYSRT
ncbi:hypothetical protein B0H17DRAFT_1097342 [Mycena rosella]|uniref:Uncharacterized protein n=1 Tax=Mycena rosella TaxID=1033263 RepID=A0AAD7CSR0_MYCRO|nr:hypothetical protein B0H17DRAFT_1097342 [Mycena rosella]